MRYGQTRSFLPKDRVKLDVEKAEILGLANMKHFCSGCKAMRDFVLDEDKWVWFCKADGNALLLQQLIIEGLVNESKYRGIYNQ